METKNWVKAGLGVVLAAGALAAGCGSSDTTPSGTGGSGGAAGSSGGMTVNNCDPATAEDHTGDASVTVTFKTPTYTPACIKIKSGSSVTWTGSFENHPLNPGTVTAGTPHQDSSSPITATASGASQTIMFTTAGTYPYYCGIHFGLGMMGAVFVE